jgi:hypothetical protein
MSAQEMRAQLNKEFDRLQREIEKYRVDSARFFGGDLKIPPEDHKEQIASDLRRLRALASRGGAAGSFRLNSLEARFNSQVDLFNRRMREQEMGGRRVVAVEKPPDPMKDGVVIGKSAANNAVETLYKGLYLQKGQSSPAMDLERFRSYIHKQASTIQSKTGASDVQFRIAVEDGKMKLKARPIKK